MNLLLLSNSHTEDQQTSLGISLKQLEREGIFAQQARCIAGWLGAASFSFNMLQTGYLTINIIKYDPSYDFFLNLYLISH